MLHMTPEMYIQVRSRNGMSCEMSGNFAPIRAMIIATPALKTNWSVRAGMTSSQDMLTGTPKASRITTSAHIENSSCWSCWRQYDTGSAARGKCRARTSPRLPEIARVPAMIELCVKVHTKTPVTRNGM